MYAFLISFLVIVPSEMADKTQLFALCLAARYKKPVPILLGMFLAIVVSHLAAGEIGKLLGGFLQGNMLHLLLGLSLIGAAIWAFIPDNLDDESCETHSNHSIFIATFIGFSIAELGDKTQLATVALAAQFHTLIPVVMGTTLGMMLVNAPAVLLSHAIARKVPLNVVRAVSGGLFAGLGLYELSKIFYG